MFSKEPCVEEYNYIGIIQYKKNKSIIAFVPEIPGCFCYLPNQEQPVFRDTYLEEEIIRELQFKLIKIFKHQQPIRPSIRIKDIHLAENEYYVHIPLQILSWKTPDLNASV
jgi:hypothetical protein